MINFKQNLILVSVCVLLQVTGHLAAICGDQEYDDTVQLCCGGVLTTGNSCNFPHFIVSLF